MSEQLEHGAVLQAGIALPVLRKWQSSDSSLRPEHLMYPLFISDDPTAFEEIPSLPEQYRIGVNRICDYLEGLVDIGLQSVLLFGVLTTTPKDSVGSTAFTEANPVFKAIRTIRSKFGDRLLVACDVCLCPYTDHGHCGILDEEGKLKNAESIKQMEKMAVAYAKAGAHMVAPSDMNDNRVAAIRDGLRGAGLGGRTSIMSYSVKFASAFYGPFRDAAQSAPAFGDRQCYQLPSGATGIGMRAAARDIEEGADVVMVKPGIPYLDLISKIKTQFPNHPVAVYHVSGEYACLWHGAKAGAFDLDAILQETLISFRRAGATIIITYATPRLLKHMKDAALDFYKNATS